MGEIEELKAQILEEASESPRKFFPVERMKERGFRRRKCSSCGKYFWSVDEQRKVCGEADCSGGYTFIDDSPTDKVLDQTTAWTEFRDFMEERGYTGIGRYPVLARWRDDTDFVRASIYDFQPYVVSGEVDPPANPLVVPQFCLRFNDIDNVGITGSHYTGFIMTGQHAFVPEEEYDQEVYFEHMLDWLVEGLGIDVEKIVLHEDAWAGGGNLGGCMEFFVDGMELLNQVYMTYEIDSSDKGYSGIDTMVLDMGMGHERVAWISNGSKTSYEANMPEVVDKLYRKTDVEADEEIRKKFLPYSGLLNADEVEDIDAKWGKIAEKIDIDKVKLKEEIQTSADIYSIADHTRALLVAFVDGALPSNTGEKHSLRVIARRALDIVDRHNWNIDLKEVMEWHAEEMEKLFPELKENIDQARRIMKHEERKYREARAKAEKIIEGLEGEVVDGEKLIDLYDTYGISPELLERFGVQVEKPKDFYSKISERHETEEEEKEEEAFDIGGIEKTEELYLKDEKKIKFTAKVLEILTHKGEKYVVLDRTCFYPTQGGQMNDLGSINGYEVLDTINKEGIILHKMDDFDFNEGETVKGKIDWKRRKQLMQHHTATHIINGAAAQVLGNHVSQAGAKKTEEKARLDITHYENLTKEELEEIEETARKWIENDYEVNKEVMKKSEAEKLYGFKIYQGGVPPGNELRIVNIGDGLDVEACGGTHVDSTSEVEEIVLVNSTKVQDGVIRLEFKSGEAARKYRSEREGTKERLSELIEMDGYTLEEVAEIFDVSVDETVDVVQRFVEEWKNRKERIEELKDFLGKEGPVYRERPKDPQELFEEWKKEEKDIDGLEEKITERVKEEITSSEEIFIREEIPVENIGNLIQTVREITKRNKDKAVVLRGLNAVIASKGSNSNYDLVREVEKEAEVVKKEGSLVKGFNLK
ncbi:MAG: alanine--tRNA ligase [Candidatus Aenigmatarchaeota archaeon]